MSAPHLSDDQLLELCLDPAHGQDHDQAHSVQTDVDRAYAHMDSCQACTARHCDLAGLLTDSRDAASDAAAMAFAPEWLTRQRARILHRISGDGRPARVLAFPGQAPALVFHRPGQATRWVAAGVAAGLAIGLVTGHLVSRPSAGTPMPSTAHAPTALDDRVPTTVATSVASISDEEFLGQLELAVARGGPESLRPLDALTPRAWDVR